MFEGVKAEQSLTLRKNNLGEDGDFDDQIISKTADYFFGSSRLREKINKFSAAHAYDYDPGNGNEYSLQLSQLHLDFCIMIEDEMTAFFQSENWQSHQFVQACRRCMLNHENGPNGIFVKCYLFAHEFDVFIQMLSTVREKIGEKRKLGNAESVNPKQASKPGSPMKKKKIESLFKSTNSPSRRKSQ